MLESHAVPFLKKWGSSFGLYREQGAESIHAQFNALNRTYCRVKPGTQRLKCMMNEHFTRLHPKSKQLRPTIPTRKRKIQPEE